MQNKTPKNEKGQKHSLWEEYYSNGNLEYKGSYINGKRHGFFEEYYPNGNPYYKGSYLNGKYIGLWIRGNHDGSIQQISFYAR